MSGRAANSQTESPNTESRFTITQIAHRQTDATILAQTGTIA
jgi:hypothetical protein